MKVTAAIEELGGWLVLLATVYVLTHHRALGREVKGLELRDGIRATVDVVERMRREGGEDKGDDEEEEEDAEAAEDLMVGKSKKRSKKSDPKSKQGMKNKSPKSSKTSDGIHEQNEVRPAEIHTCLAQLVEAGVLAMEWIKNVPELGEEEEEEEEEGEEGEERMDSEEAADPSDGDHGGNVDGRRRAHGAYGAHAGTDAILDDARDSEITLIPGLGTMVSFFLLFPAPCLLWSGLSLLSLVFSCCVFFFLPYYPSSVVIKTRKLADLRT